MEALQMSIFLRYMHVLQVTIISDGLQKQIKSLKVRLEIFLTVRQNNIKGSSKIENNFKELKHMDLNRS